ncbi:MAG: SUMF1/EgtB/PvdO family nonheme iron enzyme [Myxococcales bacterium]|nr:SUMF1/EgtB/PvdO family nonheme iron enzyme [Myxococcales bacterium]
MKAAVASLSLLFAVAGCSVAETEVTLPSAAVAAHVPTQAAESSPAPPLPAPASASAPVSASASARASASVEPPAPCPGDMVLVGRFCVDRFEAYLKKEGPTGALVDHPYFERPEKGVRYLAANDAGKFPQGYISRVESKAACEAAGKRLCSKAEWTRACKGKGGAMYPYGHRGVRGKCNTGKLHLLSELFKEKKGSFKYDEHFNSPDLNKTPGYLAKGGEYDGCISDLGVGDMVGNLHEWVSDTVDEDLVAKLEEEEVERRKQPWQVGNGVFMGGFYSTTSEHGPGCSFITIAHEPSYHDYSTGFRCCKAADLPKPEPKRAPPKPKR